MPFGLTVGAGVQYIDDIVRTRTAALGEVTVPATVLFDAMASYAISDTISLRLNATNLADEEYVDRFGGGHYVPGAGPHRLADRQLRLLSTRVAGMCRQPASARLSHAAADPERPVAEQVAECRRQLDAADWIDGRVTAGHQSAQAKDNTAAARGLARRAGSSVSSILAALERTPLFISAALPLKIFPPLFNRYAAGQSFGVHVDNAIRQVRNTAHRVRTDISATLFLAAPEEYDGGELVVEDTYGTHW